MYILVLFINSCAGIVEGGGTLFTVFGLIDGGGGGAPAPVGAATGKW